LKLKVRDEAFQRGCLHDSITGDIGGYLGLLIGGSALTIIELVDLVFYNALLKFIGKA